MKLLTKQELTERKAEEQRREIDEGLKIARQVDRLRETKAEEEASLLRFRTESIKKIQSEITELGAKRDDLANQVARLEKEREVSLIPVTELEEQAAGLLEEAKRELENARLERLNVEQESKETAGVKKTLEIKQEQAETLRQRAEELAQERMAALDEAEKERLKAIRVRAHAEAYAEAMESDLEERNNSLIVKEEAFILRVSAVDALQKRLRKKEIQLNDREKTLEREFNRLKKKNGN